MKVADYFIPLEGIEILLRLKKVLEDKGQYKFSKIIPKFDSIRFNCPFHKDGQERNPSCSLILQDKVSIKEGIVHCFTCGYSANLFEMISHLFGHQDFGDYGLKWITKEFDIVPEEQKILINVNQNLKRTINSAVNQWINLGISEEELRKYRYFHPYMYKRGLTDEIIEEYDIGYDAHFIDSNGKVWETITMPVRNLQGKVEAIIRRAIGRKRFFIPPDYEKGLYGIYEVIQEMKIEQYIYVNLYLIL